MSDEFLWSAMVDSLVKIYDAPYDEVDSWCKYTWDSGQDITFKEYQKMLYKEFQSVDPHI